jgi:hypothetical protein
MDSGMGEISLHKVLLFLHLMLNIVELDPLPLDVCETGVLCSQGVNVGDNSRISEVEECIVYDEVIVRGGVEDGEIRVSQP